MSSLPVCLPLLAFGLAAYHFWLNSQDWREAFMRASLAWGLMALCLSEGLSLFHSLTRGGLMAGWGFASLVLLLGLTFRKRRQKLSLRFPGGWESWMILAGMIVILGATALLAYAAVPNNIDSFLYHLPRVEQWIQNKSLSHFPASYDLQDYYPPWAEIAVLQFHCLSLGDHYDNLVQAFSLMGCCILASDAAAAMGASVLAQVASAAFVATLPMAILQGSSTQNDLVVSFWLLLAANQLLKLERKFSSSALLMASLSLGLALVTKGTAFIYGAPLGIWLLWLLFKALPWRRACLFALLTGVLVFAPSAGPMTRNFHCSGNVLGSSTEHANGRVDGGAIYSGVLRNLSCHIAFPSESLNVFLLRSVVAAHRIFHLEVNDPELSWKGTYLGMYGPMAAYQNHEGSAGNPMHVILLGLVLLAWMRGLLKPSPSLAYVLCAGLGIFLYCSLVRWNPWASRTHTPFFMLGAPLLGMGYESLKSRSLRVLLISTLMLGAIFIALNNKTRPHFGKKNAFNVERHAQYDFAGYFSPEFRSCAKWISSRAYPSLGLFFVGSNIEYPLWVSLKDAGWLPKIQHIQVVNSTAQLENEAPYRDFSPSAVLYVNELRTDKISLKILGINYRRVWQSGSFQIYEKP